MSAVVAASAAAGRRLREGIIEFTRERISCIRPYCNAARRSIVPEMNIPSLGLLIGTLLLGGCTAPASQMAKRAPSTGAERVLVVINTRSSASDSVGRYYAKRRGISPTHIVRLALPLDDEIGSIAFQTDLVLPVRAAIAALPVRIDFIVLTTDVPIRVARKNGNSVDAMLAGMQLAIPPMVGLDSVWLSRYRNPYFNEEGPFSSDRYGIYLVTRLACARVTDCLALVDRSVDARPVPGPFFFDAMPPRRGTDGYATMNLLLYRAAFRLPQRGVSCRPLLARCTRGNLRVHERAVLPSGARWPKPHRRSDRAGGDGSEGLRERAIHVGVGESRHSVRSLCTRR